MKRLRLSRRRVPFLPTAAARLFFDGDCDAADFKNFPGGDTDTSGPPTLGKGRRPPLAVDKILHTPPSLRCHNVGNLVKGNTPPKFGWNRVGSLFSAENQHRLSTDFKTHDLEWLFCVKLFCAGMFRALKPGFQSLARGLPVLLNY